MSYTNRTVRLGEAGLVQGISRGTHDFLYRVSTVRDPQWNVGDEVEFGAGRKATYSLSTGAAEFFNAHGVSFSETGYISITNFVVAAAVGDTEITIPAATHAALDKDDLAGGFVIIFDGGTDLYTTTRMITGNDAAASGALFKARLDGKLTYAVSTTSKVEVYKNPYASIVVSTSRDQVKAGLPMAYVPATASYFWLQTAGICWPIPQGNLGNSGGKSSGWWHDVGNVSDAVTALGLTLGGSTKSSQYAGYVVAGSMSGNGPLFKLVM